MCDRCNPRMHNAIFRIPTQIWMWSPTCSCAPSASHVQRPVMVVESGHTYERSAILSHFERNGPKDPLTRLALSSTKVMTNWAVRQMVRDKHPDVTPRAT